MKGMTLMKQLKKFQKCIHSRNEAEEMKTESKYEDGKEFYKNFSVHNFKTL